MSAGTVLTPRPRAAVQATGYAEPPALRRRRHWLVLVAVFVVASVYHAIQSLGHASPAIFTDELLFSKLAQSLASGNGFEARAEPLFFPAPLAVIAQAPAWLFGSVADGYAVAKALNAGIMASAVFPAFCLARRFMAVRWALLAAGTTVAVPALAYHSYLLSEALGYPVFLLAAATMVRAFARPSRRSELAVLAVTLVAVTTRIQFAVLPLAYLVAVALGRRAALRRHALSVGGLVALAGVALLSGGAAVGPYLGAALLDYSPLDILRYAGLTAILLPFAVGVVLFPGAVLGLAGALVRPRSEAEQAFGALALVTAVAVLAQAGLVGALEAERPLERYTIYLVPLLVVAFFAYGARGAPWRRAYVGLGLVLAFGAWLVPFPSLADPRFSFDSPTLSAYGALAFRLGHPDAATIMSGGAFAVALALVLLRLRRGHTPAALAATALAVLVGLGAVVYSGAREMSGRALRSWSQPNPSWLDDSGLGRADYLALPGTSPHFGWMFEAWNKSSGGVLKLHVPDGFNDPFASARAQVDAEGRLLADGRPAPGGLLVVADYGTRIELEGRLVDPLGRHLSLYRVPPAPRIRSLGTGIYVDRWAARLARYQVWPAGGGDRGAYRIALEVPQDFAARTVTLAVAGGAERRIRIEPGQTVEVELPAAGQPVPPLTITSDRSDQLGGLTPNPRLVSVRIPRLEYVSGSQSWKSPLWMTRGQRREPRAQGAPTLVSIGATEDGGSRPRRSP